MKLSPGLLATVAALCIAAGAVRAQYVEDSIDIGGRLVGSLVYNSREDVLYGTAYYGGFFAISCDSNKVVRSLALSYPVAVAYDSVDNKAWCVYWPSDMESLAVIDGTTHSIMKKIGMPGALQPVWDPVSNRVYVSCDMTNSVAVVDCVTDSVLAYIPVGAEPESMYINTLRRKLYVMNFDDGTVSVINMLTNQVTATVSIGGYAGIGYYSRSVDKFYCAGPEGQCVVIDGQSDSVIARIPLTDGMIGPVGATGNESMGLVYLAIYAGGSDYVVTVSAHDDSVVAAMLVGDGPCGLAYSGRNNHLYCVTTYSSRMVVLTGDGTRVLKTLPVGFYPEVTALVSRHGRFYVGHANTSYVYVVRDTSLGVAEPQTQRSGFCEALTTTPNPFRRNLAVNWNSPKKDGHVARVYAQDGRLVRQARIPAGQNRWVWDGRDDSGALLPPGVYVLQTSPGVRAKVVKLR